MSNVKLFNSLFMFAVSTTSLELTHIPEVTQSAACTLYLQILFEDNCSLSMSDWEKSRTIWLQIGIKRTTLPWVIWLLCLLHKHTGSLLKCRHISHHIRPSPTAAADKVCKPWQTPTSNRNHWCLSHCLTTAQMSCPALCNGPWQPVVAEW